MKINRFLIQFAITAIIIFGGVFTVRYIRTGELLLDQLIVAMIGIALLIASLFWKIKNKKS